MFGEQSDGVADRGCSAKTTHEETRYLFRGVREFLWGIRVVPRIEDGDDAAGVVPILGANWRPWRPPRGCQWPRVGALVLSSMKLGGGGIATKHHEGSLSA